MNNKKTNKSAIKVLRASKQKRREAKKESTNMGACLLSIFQEEISKGDDTANWMHRRDTKWSDLCLLQLHVWVLVVIQAFISIYPTMPTKTLIHHCCIQKSGRGKKKAISSPSYMLGKA